MRRLVILLFVLCCGCGAQSEDAENTASRPLANQNRPGTATWTAPAGWVTESPSSNFRKAQYRLPRVDQDPEDASCIVFHFQGGGGGVEANLQRWYGQFTQPGGRPSNEVATVKRSSVNGLRQTRLDLTGTYLFKTSPMAPNHTEKPAFRMLAGVVESSTGPWFVKLVGPERTVAKWETSFSEFLDSFKE